MRPRDTEAPPDTGMTGRPPVPSYRERFLEALLESATDYAIITMDLDGLVTSWNEGARRILLWTEEEILGRPASVFFTLEDRQAGIPHAELTDALEHGRGTDERWHQRKDGTRFWANGEMMPLRDEAGAVIGVIKILRDRTPQRQAAERQRADAEFLRSVLAASADCIKVLDLDARITFMSEGGQRLMQVHDFDTVRGRRWPDFWQGQGRHDAEAALVAAMQGGTGHFQGPADTLAGTPRVWDVQVTPIPGADGRPEKLLVVSRDITDSVRAGERLLLSEQSLRLTTEAAEIGTWELDPRTGALAASDRTKAMFGIAPDGAFTMDDFQACLHPDDRAATIAALQSALDPARRVTYDVEYRAIGRNDGVVRWVAAKGRGFFDAAGHCTRALGTAVDITARRAVEQRLRDSEARLRELNATLETRVAERTADRDRMWQLSTDVMLAARFDGTILAVNPAWTRVLGWAEEELVGRSYFDLVHPEDLAPTRDAARRLAEGETITRFDNRYRHRDGSIRWISWAAVPGQGLISSVGRDVTGERAKAAALERSQARLRSVFETSYQFQFLLSPDGILLDANATSLAAIGATLAEVAGMAYWETPWFAATPELAAQVRAAIPRVAAGQTVRQEIVVDLPTGRRAFDFSLRPMRDPSGTVIGIVPEAMELTERRAAEEQLRQSQKMEAVGQLTGGLAHDFNNLLTGIGGSLELLKLRVAQGRLDNLDRYIVAAQGAAARAAALTHRLLAFSRRQTLDPRPTDPNGLVAGMEELIRRTVGPEIEVETALADGLWPTLCDANQLENAILNLCINARDAMPDGGRLTVETANTTLDERSARERDMLAGAYVAICVTDTGTGMTPGVVARAFDPFFTTKPLGMGTGLGLSMIYGFARQSGGQVRIYSELGHGTTVRLYLPRFTGEAAPAGSTLAAGPAPRAEAGESVLIVDDEPTVRMLIAEVLQELGYAALEAADAAEGLAVVQSAARIDLLITDVGLPGGINGRQLADAALLARPELKVLFITGYAERAAIGNFDLPAGMQVIAKPFEMDVLANRISGILRGS
jgi:PAS domain S-box-containing protein